MKINKCLGYDAGGFECGGQGGKDLCPGGFQGTGFLLIGGNAEEVCVEVDIRCMEAFFGRDQALKTAGSVFEDRYLSIL